MTAPVAPQPDHDPSEVVYAIRLQNWKNGGAHVMDTDEAERIVGEMVDAAERRGRESETADTMKAVKRCVDLQNDLRACQLELCPEFEICADDLSDGAKCACGFVDGPFGNSIPPNHTQHALADLKAAQTRIAALEAALRERVVCEDEEFGECQLCRVIWDIGEEAHRPDCALAAPCSAPGGATQDRPAAPRWTPTHRHYKGDLYRVIGPIQLSEDRDVPHTEYENANGKRLARPTAMFEGYLEDGRRRFEPLTQVPAMPEFACAPAAPREDGYDGEQLRAISKDRVERDIEKMRKAAPREEGS